jgi:hypothetical protein
MPGKRGKGKGKEQPETVALRQQVTVKHAFLALIAAARGVDLLLAVDGPLRDRLLNELGLVSCVHLRAECIAAQPELSETGLEGYRTTTDCDTTAPYTRSALLGALRIDDAVANGGTWPSVEAAAAKRAACGGGAQSPEEPAENKRGAHMGLGGGTHQVPSRSAYRGSAGASWSMSRRLSRVRRKCSCVSPCRKDSTSRTRRHSCHTSRPGPQHAHVAGAGKVLGWPKICKLAHEFMWEHSCKLLKLAQLLGQLGVFLTWA